MKLFYLTLILVITLGGIFYLKDEVSNFYLRFTDSLQEIEKVSLDAVSEAVEDIITAPPPLRSPTTSSGAPITVAGTIKATNAARASNGLPPLVENSKLDTAARAKVADMFELQYFEHVSPTGRNVSNLVKDVQYEFIAVGENLALGNYKDDQDLVTAWMNSPGHRANILNSRYTEIGVGVGKGVFEGRSTWLAVQIFGLPATACPQPDARLKTQIDANKITLANLGAQIEAMKKEIDGMKRNDPEYNAKVQEYNALIAKYNDLVAETRNLVDAYNASVRERNECAEVH